MIDFDIEKIKAVTFSRRTAIVKTPNMPWLFIDDQSPEIEIQGLTGEEVAIARQRQIQNAAFSEVLEKFAGGKLPEKVLAMKESLGLSNEKVPDVHAYEIAVLQYGISSFSCNQEIAVKIAYANPLDFRKLVDEIGYLTGLGMRPGE